MIVRVLRLASIVFALAIVGGFGLFAIDETQAASEQSQREIAGGVVGPVIDPAPEQERVREQRNGTEREVIDDVNDVLLRPFTGVIATTQDDWLRRGVPALLGLLVYGLGLASLARYVQTR